MNDNHDDSWNIDLFYDNLNDSNNYNNFSYQYNGQTIVDDEWSLQNIYYEYCSLYQQLRPLMSLAQQILDPDSVQQYQNKLDIFETNIGYLENNFNTSGEFLSILE